MGDRRHRETLWPAHADHHRSRADIATGTACGPPSPQAPCAHHPRPLVTGTSPPLPCTCGVDLDSRHRMPTTPPTPSVCANRVIDTVSSTDHLCASMPLALHAINTTTLWPSPPPPYSCLSGRPHIDMEWWGERERPSGGATGEGVVVGMWEWEWREGEGVGVGDTERETEWVITIANRHWPEVEVQQ